MYISRFNLRICEYEICPIKTLPYISQKVHTLTWDGISGGLRKAHFALFFFFSAHMISLLVGTGSTVLWNHFPEIPHNWLLPCIRVLSFQHSSHNRPVLPVTSNNNSECNLPMEINSKLERSPPCFLEWLNTFIVTKRHSLDRSCFTNVFRQHSKILQICASFM